MFFLLEIFGLFSVADDVGAVTRPENQTPVRVTLLLTAILVNTGLLTGWPDRPGFDPVTFAAVGAAQLVAALLLVALMHRLRPIGPDIPRRRWSDTHDRSAGPLAFAAIGAALVSGGVHLHAPGAATGAAALGVVGLLVAGLGVAALVHQARSPF